MAGNRFALVLTDTHMIPGVHALLNALIYYGCEEVDVHYLWWPGSPAQAALDAGTYSFYPHFYPQRFDAGLFPPEYGPLFGDAPNACYHMRWAYAGSLTQYLAVSIFDADILLCNNILPYFDLAAQTEFFITPNNDYSGFEREAPHLSGIQGDASPPWHNQPCFFAPNIWGSFMRDIPLVGMAEKRSDIVALSRMLIERELLDRVLTLPNCLWLQTHYCNLKLRPRNVGDKRYLALHENGDRLNAVHRRWWIPSICTQFVTDITPGPDREIGLNNIRLFHEMYRFFNQDCAHRLEGDFSWEEPI